MNFSCFAVKSWCPQQTLISSETVGKYCVAAIILACAFGIERAVAQSDDFNDGNDVGWQKVDLTVVGSPGSFTFPDDGTGGKAYRIKVGAPAVDVAGPARAFSYRSANYTNFVVSVDILAWDQTVDQAFGLLTRATNPGLGTTDGYVMNFNPADGNLQINEVSGEFPITIAETPARLDPAQARYRWVFSGYNDSLVGLVYALPDTNDPVASVVASDFTHANGVAGVFDFSRANTVTDPSATADATFDNYNASVPAPGSLRATVVDLTPKPNEAVRTIPTSLSVAILNRETDVDANSIVVSVDGSVIPSANLTVSGEVVVPNNTTPFPGATVSYPLNNLTNLADLTAAHTNRIVFADTLGFKQTNEWVFTFASLRGTNASPVGSGAAPGFSVRLVQASVVTDNSLARAELQLGPNPPANYAAFVTNAVASVINYTQKDTTDPSYIPDGNFGNEFNFPGIDPAVQTDPNDMAMEILTYLELSPGVHTFGVVSDDGFQLSSGASFSDPNALVLGQKTSGTFNGTFDFVVPQGGIYPFRMIWFERGGGASVELFSVNRSTNVLTLINDPNATDAIKAYTSLAAAGIVLESASSLAPSSFAAESGAVVDTNAKTVTVARSGNQRFYRLQTTSALTIDSIQISGGNVILNYH
jgi:sulfur carrier protein ThiS